MAEYKRYERYKESGVEWMGKVPQNWFNSKISWSFNTIGSGGTPTSTNKEYYGGDTNWLITGDLNDGIIKSTSKKITKLALRKYSTLKVYPKNSLVVAMYGATIGKLGITEMETTTNQACCVLTKPIDVDIKYMFYWFLGNRNGIINLSQGGGQPNISQSLVKSLKLYKPSIKEQKQIANFLDTKTTEIGSLIADKEKLITLLEEKSKVIIAESVTKGLNRNVKMKDSGVEWIENIPEHWGVKKAKYIAKITRGAILRPVDDPSYFDENGEWTYLNISDATLCDKYLNEGKLRLSQLGSRKSARVKPNNLIITASATIGKPFINKIKVCIHDGFIAFTQITMDIDYLFYFLKNSCIYDSLGKSNTQKNIYLDEVKNIFLTIPTMDEQKLIAKYLEEYTKNIIVLISDIKIQIEKLKEYRQSLILDAVTGKIDVRDYSKEA